MKIKTYVVPTLSEAVEKIKKDLGPQAIILSTRKAQVKDSWWKPGQVRLEVTAAVDDGEEDRTIARDAPGVNDTVRMITQLTEQKITPLRRELAKMKETMTHLKMPASSEAPQRTPQANHNNMKPLFGRIAVPMDQVHRLKDHGDSIIDICRRLLWHHVHAEVVQELADDLLTREDVASMGVTKEYAAQWLLEKLPDPNYFLPSRGQGRIMAVLGPTGSGKTTTLAKLASHLSLDHKKSIAFVTLDHYRIGAEEQLRKYAQILRAPCALAVDKDQFRRALKQFEGADCILVDTVGRSPQDLLGIEAIGETLQVGEPVWKSLVIPATLREPDLEQTVRQFGASGVNRLIMTKLDETTSFGSLYNASQMTGFPLSYFTMGQQVPEDFELAGKERVIDCLFNFSGSYAQPRYVGHDEEAKAP